MKLVLVDDDGETQEIPDIPAEILEALWAAEVELVTQYIGWDPQDGILTRSTNPMTMMRDRENGWRAGYLSLILTDQVQAKPDTLERCFLPYMSIDERRAKGYKR